jgi:RimJ/RimL family protein N-acetyltransferase
MLRPVETSLVVNFCLILIMFNFNRIDIQGFYAEQLIHPKTIEDYKIFGPDILFLISSVKSDTEMQRWFPDLYNYVTVEQEPLETVFLLLQKITSEHLIYFSIRNKENSEVIGFLKFMGSKYSAINLEFYLIETYRRRGIIKRILNGLFKQFQYAGIICVSANVNINNKKSQNLLEGMEFNKENVSGDKIYYAYHLGRNE